MPFDLSTAKPVSNAPSNGGFDLASAKPITDKPKADFYDQLGTSLRQGFVSSGNLVDRAVSGTAGALANAVSGPDEADKVFREMDERVRQRNQWANPDNVDVGPLAGVLGKIPNLPANLSTALLSPFETGQEMIQNGESLGTAQAGQAISGVGNAIGFGTPAAVGTNIATKLLTGGASNAAQAYAQGKALEAISNTPESQKQFAPTGRSVGEAALLGFGMGAIAPNKPVKDLFHKPNNVLDNLDKQSKFDLETAKPVDEAPQTSTAMTPSQLKEWADLQERYAQYKRGELPEQKQAAAQAAIDARQAQLEQDVARQGGLDRNASERARQEAAPTGYADWVEQQRQSANQRVPGDNTPMELGPSVLRSAKNYPDVNDFPNLLQDAPYQYEGGIDYTAPRDRAALPVEVADTLRTGDKVPDPFSRISYGQNAKRMAQPLEDHIANLNRSEAQPNAISRFEGEGNVSRTPKASVTTPDPTIGRWEGEGGKFGQRGAIDVKGIQEAYRKMKDGEGSLFDYLRSFKGTFDESYGHDMAIKTALNDTMDPKSRSRIVFMSPDDFHKLALNRDKSSFAKNSIGEEKRVSIREGLASDEGLVSVPMLKVDSGKVIGHEGRHRMDVFKENGIEQVPVIVRDTMHRNENGPLPYRHLISENGMRTIPIERLTDLNPIQSKGIKNKQSGKVDIQSIKEEAEKVGKWFSSVGAKAMDNLTPKERIAISAVGDDSYIPKGDTPEKIIAAAKAQPDGPALFTQMQSGLGGAALKTGSAIMFGVNRHLQWAHKVAAKSFRELVKPIEQKLSLLSTDDAITANGILRKEIFDRQTFTEQQLRDAGASDKVIGAYKALRDSFNDVYTKTNEARAKLGLEPITQQSAYYSSQWMGNWHMPVHDKSGNLIGYVKTETRAEANKAMAWIKKNMPEADVSSLKIEYKPENIGKSLPRDVTSTFEAMMKIFEDTPMAQQMKEMMDQYRTEQAFNERGFSKHFEEKANTRFFLGDRPWLSDKENAHAGLKSQVQYLKDAYRWIPMQEAMANIKEVLSDPDLVKSQPNNMAVAKAYTANALGVSQSIMRGLENDVAKMMGRSPSSLGAWTSGLKSFTYLQQLGISAGYVIATPTQAFILGPSRHMLLSKEGFKYNPITTMVKSLKDMAALMATHEAYNVTGKDFRNNLSPVGREALRYMEDNGIINMNLFDEYANLGENRAMNLAKNTVGATISFPEKMARTMTFMSFVHHLKEGGMEIGNDMFRKAEELTNATLTEFHKNARPLIVDRMGMTGELLYTYKSPLFNFYNSLFEFGRKASETGDYKPLLTALFMTTALGGVMNFPLMQEMDGAWSLMKDFIAKHYPNFYDSIRDTGVKQFALKHLPDILTYGAMSSVTGAQMESRFSNQIIDPENPLGNVAPVAQEIKEQAALGRFAMHPNWTTFHEGLYQNLPPAAKGFQETTADSFKAEKRPDGTTTYFNPNKLDERQAYVNRTKSDETYRKLGLTSLPEARQRDVRYASGQESMRLETARDSSMTKMFDAVIRKDQEDVQKYAIAYFKNDGNEQEFQSQLANKIMASGLTPEERQAVYLKTISDAKNIVRRLQMEQKIK